MNQVPVVVMGVSGAGKSTVGRQIAELGGREFVDADDLHPIENRRKMAAGVPLADEDRLPWLAAVAAVLDRPERPIVACSALKLSYRELLRAGAPGVAFVYLSGDRETIRARLSNRAHEFMPESLMSTQFETLEPPSGEPRVLELDIRYSAADLTDLSLRWVRELENTRDAEAG